MATSDLTKHFYAGWYLALCDQHGVARPHSSQEAHGDLVDLGMGICYLVSMFPRRLRHVLNERAKQDVETNTNIFAIQTRTAIAYGNRQERKQEIQKGMLLHGKRPSDCQGMESRTRGP